MRGRAAAGAGCAARGRVRAGRGGTVAEIGGTGLDGEAPGAGLDGSARGGGGTIAIIVFCGPDVISVAQRGQRAGCPAITSTSA